jgi:glycosyltransferase involved in cell wall biosynthesis
MRPSGAGRTAAVPTRGSTLILVENLSVPFDRRVWQEATSLRRAGFAVTVICPQGHRRDNELHAFIDGVEIHRFPLEPAGGGMLGYAREYGTAFRRTAALVRRLARRRTFDVVHACNPPDALFLTALRLRRRGAAFVFDHHDLVPELYLSRFGRRGLVHRATLVGERVTFMLADVVISTNESYRRVAIQRGRIPPENVFVVRSAPDPDRMRPVTPDRSLRRGKTHLLAYLGVMGPQDGVDHALRALAALRARRQDWHAIFIGGGDVFDEMQMLARCLGLDSDVEFTGRVPDEDVVRILSSADVCLSPDPKNPLNDVSTMNKVIEYMSLARPIVSYDLVEARVSAGGAALYAEANNVDEFARRIEQLLDSPGLRERMGRAGRRRVEEEISWHYSEAALLAAYDRALTIHRLRTRLPDDAPTW